MAIDTTEREVRLFNIYGFDGGNYAGNVYDKDYLSPCIRTFGGAISNQW